eukprot:scaffold7748_cov156-Amphora_coffeaeformis.AAC.2
MKLSTVLLFPLLSVSYAKWFGRNGRLGRKGRKNGGGTNNNQAVASTSLNAEEIEKLVFMREEEKLARDVYLTMAELYGDKVTVFDNIARSEQQHMDRVLTMLNQYGVEDPVVNNTVSAFTDKELGALYKDLVNEGAGSLRAALYVGALIEEIDIGDLQTSIALTNQAMIQNVYGSLLRASENHLRAFVRQLGYLGETGYTKQHLSQDQVDAILG